MMHVHQASVSSYLEDVILGSLQQTADSEARKEVQHQATLINTLANHFQHTYATHTDSYSVQLRECWNSRTTIIVPVMHNNMIVHCTCAVMCCSTVHACECKQHKMTFHCGWTCTLYFLIIIMILSWLCRDSACREESGRELVAEMVYSFLLPEVEKQTMRERGDGVRE